MRPDRMKELGQHISCEALRALLDHPQAEVDVPEQLALAGGNEERARIQLSRSAEVVQERCRQHEIRSQATMKPRRLPAEGRHRDRVLKQSAGVRVMSVGCCGQLPEPFPQRVVVHERLDGRSQTRVGQLISEKLEEPVQLGDIPRRRWNEGCRIRVGDRLHRPKVELQALVEALDAAENPDSVTFREALVEHLDIAPDARVDSAARVDKLKREVRRACPCGTPQLSSNRVDAVDESIGFEASDSWRVAHDRRV